MQSVHASAKRRRRRWPVLLLVVAAVAVVVAAVVLCTYDTVDDDDHDYYAIEGETLATLRSEARHSLEGYVITDDVPLSSRKYYKIFTDNNDIQLAAARLNGIDHPFGRRDDFVNHPKLLAMQPCALYDIAELTHSLPYLVPSARVLLDDIAMLFRAKVSERYEGADCRIIVTSLLRTEEDIRRLRRRNRNATEKSCHRYGTTFDIAYARFDQGEGRAINDGVLKHILAETLYELRRQGRCFVIYERRQRCFHITVRNVNYKFGSVNECIATIRHYAMAESGNGRYPVVKCMDMAPTLPQPTPQPILQSVSPQQPAQQPKAATAKGTAKDYTIISGTVYDTTPIPFL